MKNSRTSHRPFGELRLVGFDTGLTTILLLAGDIPSPLFEESGFLSFEFLNGLRTYRHRRVFLYSGTVLVPDENACMHFIFYSSLFHF